MSRRSITPEFKHEAASLVVQQNYTIKQACQALGVGETAMRRWVRQLQQELQGVTPSSKALTPEQQRIQELEACQSASNFDQQTASKFDQANQPFFLLCLKR